VDNKIEWTDKKRGEVKIKIGGKRARMIENYQIELIKPDAIITIGYGFFSQEKMYIDHYPYTNLIIFDKRDFTNKPNPLANRANEKHGSGYIKIIDDVNSIFYRLEI
jgi:hypothetical protein